MYTAKPTLTSRVSILSKGVLDGLKLEGRWGLYLGGLSGKTKKNISKQGDTGSLRYI